MTVYAPSLYLSPGGGEIVSLRGIPACAGMTAMGVATS